MIVCPTPTIDTTCPIQATPAITAGKKNADRIVSQDRRIIADTRRVNHVFDPRQYYIAMAPTMTGVARTIIALVRKRPRIQIVMAKRDIASALRLLRVYPALAQLMVTELPGRRVGLEPDIVLFHLVMPFGWGAPPPASLPLVMRCHWNTHLMA